MSTAREAAATNASNARVLGHISLWLGVGALCSAILIDSNWRVKACIGGIGAAAGLFVGLRALDARRACESPRPALPVVGVTVCALILLGFGLFALSYPVAIHM